MLKTHKRNTNIGVGIGWLLLLVANIVGRRYGLMIGAPIYLLGIALFLWGCIEYARGKGYSPYWGALGLLYILGLLVLVCMPDKHKGAT